MDHEPRSRVVLEEIRGEKTGYNTSIPSVQEEVPHEMDIDIPLPRRSGRIADTRVYPE